MKGHKVKRLTTLAAAIILVGVIIAPTLSSAAPNGPGASGWKLGYYTPSGRALSTSQTAPGEGVAAINFTTQDNTALLINTQGNSTLLGNDLSKTVSATFTISGATSDFTYYGETDACGTAASTRLFFETRYGVGGFSSTDYWWADNASYTLADNGNGVTIHAVISPSGSWSAFYGEKSAEYATSFSAAASNVTGIGLSFGGGCFFENGVGTVNGSGTFTLTNFSVS